MNLALTFAAAAFSGLPMLKSRRKHPPGGWKFTQPQTGWMSTPGLDFETVVESIIKHRLANPRFDLATDFQVVANELDAYTCARLNNNPSYCVAGDASKKAQSPSVVARLRSGAESVAGAGRNVVVGIGVLLDWLGSGGAAVAPALAESRAAICATCPKNSR